MYSLPTLSSLYPKPKKRMKRLPTRSLTYWGILAVEAANKDQEDCQEDDIHLQRLAWDDTVTSHGYRVSVHISTGAIPLLFSVHNMEVVLPIEVEVPSIQVCRSPSLIELKIHDDLAQLYQRGSNKLPTRRFVPVKFDDFYNYGWWQTRTSCESRCSQEILCQKSSISRKS